MIDWRDRHSLIPAVYVLLRQKDKVLLLQRANTGYRDGQYSLPAGHLDGGESALAAVIREAKEEVGVDINAQDLKLVHTQHRVADEGNHERLNLFFETHTWQGTPINNEPDRCDGIKWFGLDDLPSNLVIELQHLFPCLAKGENYGDFGF